MPKMIHPESGDTIEIESANDIAAAQAEGYQLVPGTGDVALTTPSGRETVVKGTELDQAVQLLPQSTAVDPASLITRGAAAYEAQEFEEQYGGFKGNARALTEGVLSGFSLGGYDVAADWLGMDTEKYAQANPNFRLAGELGSIVTATVATGGAGGAAKLGKFGAAVAKTPAGAISSRATSLGSRIGGLKGAAAAQAAEGAAYAAAQTTSQVLIDNDPLTAEAAVSEVLKSAMVGGALSGGAAVLFGGIGSVSNKLIKGLDDANPTLNLSGAKAKKLGDQVGKSLNELDLTVEHGLAQAERSAGVAAKLSPDEANRFAKHHAVVSQFGAELDAATDAMSRTSVRAPRGFAQFNESMQDMHEHLGQLLGPGHRATPKGLAFDEAGDALFAAVAANDPQATLRAMSKYRTQVKSVARGLKVDVGEDLKKLDDFASRLAGPAEIGLADDVEASYKKFKLSRDSFEASGGIKPEAIERLILDATENGSKQAIAQLRRHVENMGELAGMIGATVPDDVAKLLDDLEPTLANIKAPRPGFDPKALEGMRTSQTKAREAFGVEPGKPITAGHVLDALRGDTAVLAPKLRSFGQYFDDATKFAAASGDDLMAQRLQRMGNEISGSVNEALEGAGLERLTKEAIGMILGAEVLEYSGLPGPMDDLLQLAALHKLVKGAGKTKMKSNRLMKSIASRVGSRLLPAAARKAGVVPSGQVLGPSVAGGFMAGGYSMGGWLHDAITGQGSISALGSSVRGKFGELLDDVAKAGKAVSRPGALGVSWMMHSRFGFGDDEDDNAPGIASHGDSREGLHAAFTARAAELTKIAAAPLSAQAQIHESLKPMRLMSERLADQIEMQSMRIPLWLYEKLPKDPGDMYTLGVSRWKPSEVQILEFAEYGRGALFPVETIEGALNGDISPEAAEAVRTLWPEHFAAFQLEVMKRAPKLADELTYEQQTRLFILTDVPIDSTHLPEFRAFMNEYQAGRAAAAEESMAKPKTSSSSSSSEAEAEMSPAQRLMR